jgi:hypothetical protein
MRQKAKDPSARTSMMIAIIMHAIAFLVFFVWADKTGRLDPILKVMNVVPVREEKKKETAKEEKKEEMIKPSELPKINSTPAAAANSPPPPTGASTAPAAPPAVAPPPAVLADFAFDDGAKVVETTTNATFVYYKNLIEYTLRANWNRPSDAADDTYVAEAQVYVDNAGRILRYEWVKGSGDKHWDDSVRKALAQTKAINRSPPKGFPDKFLVRFDVVPANEPLLQ